MLFAKFIIPSKKAQNMPKKIICFPFTFGITPYFKFEFSVFIYEFFIMRYKHFYKLIP